MLQGILLKSSGKVPISFMGMYTSNWKEKQKLELIFGGKKPVITVKDWNK